MSIDSLKKDTSCHKLQVVVSLVFVCFLLLSVFALDYSEIFAGLLLLLGFVAFVNFKEGSRRLPFSDLEKYLLVALALYSLLSIVAFLYWPITKESHMRVEDDLKFLMFIPLYLLVRQMSFDRKKLIVVVALLSTLMGGVSLVQYLQFDFIVALYPFTYINRPSAGVNPMRYAVIAVLAVCFIFNFWVTYKNKSNFMRVCLLLAMILGMVACVLTQTRGVLLSLPLLALLYGYYLYRKGDRKYLLAFLVGVFLIFLGASQSSFVQKRIDTTVLNVERYMAGDGISSLGVRLDMYKACMILFKESPVFGHGLGVFREKSKELKDAGSLGDKVHDEVGSRKTPHNEFFQAVIERGLIGLLVTMFLFIVPGLIFYRATISSDRDVSFYGLSGMSLLVVFFVAGQTGTLFNHNLFTNFYIIMVLLFVSQIRVLEDKEEKAGLVES
jgi:O-antigen ligase